MTAKEIKRNPYDWINPINDPLLFAGRKEELTTIMEEIDRLGGDKPIRPIITVIGERRVGKTSLLLRIENECTKKPLKTVIITIEDNMVKNVWEFWNEIFIQLRLSALKDGVVINPEIDKSTGFIRDIENYKPTYTINTFFQNEYNIHLSTKGTHSLSTTIIQNDMEQFSNAFQQLGYNGFLLLLDEAHILLKAQEITQQIRKVIQLTNRCGIIFSGETKLASMFTEPSEPFYGQANIISLPNFIDADEVAECALLPLDSDELKLISPMTINYLARLSRGKPNQVNMQQYI